MSMRFRRLRIIASSLNVVVFIRFQFSAHGGQLYKRISLESKCESHYLASIGRCVISSLYPRETQE